MPEESATSTSDASDRQPRWRRRPAERRSEIVDAAASVFGQRGYDHATLTDIAKRAGVCVGTVAHYFGSKEDLFRAALFDRLHEEFAKEEAILAGHQGSYRSLIVGLLQRMADRVRRLGTGDLLFTGLAQASTFPEAGHLLCTEVGDRWRRLFSGAIEAGIQHGEFRRLDPDRTARVLASALMGMLVAHARLSHFDPRSPTADHMVETYLDLVSHALIEPGTP
ncbi:MAG: TetR/AcrR family transcriptional regulator [Gemmatimonadales bacterium]|nr:TetR/AcrR family transcriptional regulator [Gemmatimonadales bacterium]